MSIKNDGEPKPAQPYSVSSEDPFVRRRPERSQPVMVFLRTKFARAESPQLSSIGLVTLDGEEFKATHLSTTGPGRTLAAALRKLAPKHVQNRIAEASPEEAELGEALGIWLFAQFEKNGPDALVLVIDSVIDFELMEDILRVAGTWDTFQLVLLPVHINILVPNAEVVARDIQEAAMRDQTGEWAAIAEARTLRAVYLTAQQASLLR